VLKNRPLSIKREAGSPVVVALDKFEPHEQRLLDSLAWRDPIDGYERLLWHSYVSAVWTERRRQPVENWSVPDLMGLLSSAQERALQWAEEHLRWTDVETGVVLRAASPTLMAAQRDALVGIANRERSPLTHWTEWQELYEASTPTG
jgi:hypothetical protein